MQLGGRVDHPLADAGRPLLAVDAHAHRELAERRQAGSPIVVIHGPMPNAKSLHFCGPIPIPISRAWMSRAEKSLKIVSPNSSSSGLLGRQVAALASDDEAELELVVDLLGERGVGDDLVVAEDDPGGALEVPRRLEELGVRRLRRRGARRTASCARGRSASRG